MASLGPRKTVLTHHQICRPQLNLVVTLYLITTRWTGHLLGTEGVEGCFPAMKAGQRPHQACCQSVRPLGHSLISAFPWLPAVQTLCWKLSLSVDRRGSWERWACPALGGSFPDRLPMKPLWAQGRGYCWWGATAACRLIVTFLLCHSEHLLHDSPSPAHLSLLILLPTQHVSLSGTVCVRVFTWDFRLL